MQIRRATHRDMEGINHLLCQVLMVHHVGRPDIFKPNAKKYTDRELLAIIEDDAKPIFVAEEDGKILGYAFCIVQQYMDNNILTDIKTLYVDDLCVDETARGMHLGTQLYEYVKAFAKAQGCYNLTLNVWSCNEGALRFYERCGLVPQKIGLECVL